MGNVYWIYVFDYSAIEKVGFVDDFIELVCASDGILFRIKLGGKKYIIMIEHDSWVNLKVGNIIKFIEKHTKWVDELFDGKCEWESHADLWEIRGIIIEQFEVKHKIHRGPLPEYG